MSEARASVLVVEDENAVAFDVICRLVLEVGDRAHRPGER